MALEKSKSVTKALCFLLSLSLIKAAVSEKTKNITENNPCRTIHSPQYWETYKNLCDAQSQFKINTKAYRVVNKTLYNQQDMNSGEYIICNINRQSFGLMRWRYSQFKQKQIARNVKDIERYQQKLRELSNEKNKK